MYYYGMRLRPFGIGCQPKDCVYRVEGVVAEGYWDIIAYERKLSEDEMYQYDLDDVTNAGWALTANGSFQPESEYDNLSDALYVRTEWEAFDKEHGEECSYKIVML